MPIVSNCRQSRLPPTWASLLCLAPAGTTVSDPAAPAADGGSADEAAVSLNELVRDRTVREQARTALYHLAVREPTHLGWKDIYDNLLAN